MKNKYYTVWCGRQTGVFDSWDKCRMQVDGFRGARFKGFPNRAAAEAAFKNGYDVSKTQNLEPMQWRDLPDYSSKPDTNAIAVDAACSGNPGKMEYRGVFVETGTELFRSQVFEDGTNNVGEFLAIVHCLAWQQKYHLAIPIYSDSLNGQKWVRDGICNTNLKRNKKNELLFEVIARAEKWLHDNTFRVPVYKWRTELWGEIPADFGRKR